MENTTYKHYEEIMNDETKTVTITFSCPICWERKEKEFKSYMEARQCTAVYCDACVTKKMVCITEDAEELIALLD